VGKEDYVEMEGNVLTSLPNAMFRVKLDSGHEILCSISGKIRSNFIKILVGDRVTVEISKYDVTKGRISYRTKG
jgi:translation initiation factor IF-1